MGRRINTAKIKDVIVRIENNNAYPLQIYEYHRLKDLLKKKRKQRK